MLKCRENNPQVPVQAVSGFASWLGGGGARGVLFSGLGGGGSTGCMAFGLK
jgi:hypothetical protein